MASIRQAIQPFNCSFQNAEVKGRRLDYLNVNRRLDIVCEKSPLTFETRASGPSHEEWLDVRSVAPLLCFQKRRKWFSNRSLPFLNEGCMGVVQQ